MSILKIISYTLFVFVLSFFLNHLTFASTNQSNQDISNINQATLTKSCTIQSGVMSEKDRQSPISISLSQEAMVNEEVLMELVFAENILPNTAIPSIKIEVIQSPDESKVNVLSGVPITKLSFNTAGIYSFKARIGYLIKSS